MQDEWRKSTDFELEVNDGGHLLAGVIESKRGRGEEGEKAVVL